MRRISRLSIGLVLTSVNVFGATLTLTIVDPDGAPISQAVVSAVRQSAYVPARNGRAPQLAPGEVDFGASWITDNVGIVYASSIPAGNYLVCVQKPNSPLLDPCVWASPVVVAGLQAQELRDLGNVVIPSGILVTLSVSDPLGLLPNWNDISPDGGLIAGIFHDNRNWTPATRNPRKTFTYAVPLGKPYQLRLFSRTYLYSFSGPTAASTAAGLLSPTRAAGTEAAGGYQITITGTQPGAQN